MRKTADTMRKSYARNENNSLQSANVYVEIFMYVCTHIYNGDKAIDSVNNRHIYV